MAGLYRQTYKQKPTIKLAPDAFIMIGEKKTIEVCPKCGSEVNISDFITSIQTTLATNGTVGTASFTISMPRHGHDGVHMVRGGRVFGLYLMDEVEIYIKARFPLGDNSEKEYQYHRVFWGMIVNIQESYSDGYQNITVNCESILKWLQIMTTNEQPSQVFANTFKNVGVDIASQALYGKTYADLTPYEIIYQMLTITYQNIYATSALDTEKNIEGDDAEPGLSSSLIGRRDIDLMRYWQQRFSRLKANLRLFGTSPDDFLGFEQKSNNDAANNSNRPEAVVSKNKVSPIAINYDSKALMDFKPFNKREEAKQLDPVMNSYKSNLEIINEVKLVTGYEFYLDTSGEIIFKPPFWNLDTSENNVYYIKDTDILSWDFSEDANEVVTRVDVTGALSFYEAGDQKTNKKASFTDYRMARQFGLKVHQISNRYLTTPQLCYYHAISELDRINANRYRATLTIVGRPELKLGLPVYIESRDCFGYIDSIAHNFTFGGQFTTVVELSAIRRKYLGDSSVASDFKFIDESTRAFKFIGKPSILINTALPGIDEILKADVGEQGKTAIRDLKNKQTSNTTNEKQISVKDSKFYASNADGKYEEFLLTDPRAQEVLRAAQNAKNQDNQEAYLRFLEIAIPISDEEGYELIGVFENGRSLKLTQNNILTKKGKNFGELLSNALKNKKDAGKINNVQPQGDERGARNKKNTAEQVQQRDDNTAISISNFVQVKAKFLKDLTPTIKDAKACNCYGVKSTANIPDALKSNSNRLVSKQKPKARTQTPSE